MVNGFASIGKVGTQMRVEQTSLDPTPRQIVSVKKRYRHAGGGSSCACRWRWCQDQVPVYNLVGIHPHRWLKAMAWPSLTAQFWVDVRNLW